MLTRKPHCPVVLLAAVALLCGGAAAQTGSEQANELTDQALTPEDSPVIREEIRLVTVPVTVTGPDGEYVTGLEKSDFTIYDNEKPQEIDSFEVSFLPISMVICVQSSERVEGLLPDVKETALLFTDLVLGEFGQAAVIAFDNRVRVMQDFTGKSEEIDKALKDITVGSDAVRLADAVYEGIRMLVRRPANHRRVIVVISESQETASEVGLGETLRTAQLNDIMIYPVRLSSLAARYTREPDRRRDPIPPGVSARPVAPGQPNTPTVVAQSYNYKSTNLIPLIIDLVRGTKNLVFKNPLGVLAKGTGGYDYSPRTESGLQRAINRIGEDLRSQYLLTYRPNNLNESGIFHRIEVKVAYDQLEVRARPGYFLGPSPVSPDTGAVAESAGEE